MHKERLIKNMIDQVKEAQMKLGYARETVRLYYPLQSLNALLGTEAEDEKELLELLRETWKEPGTLGLLRFHVHTGRIEVSVPPEGADWVHEHVETPPFLEELIRLFQTRHACTLEEIQAVFDRFGESVCDRMPEGSDFDYAIHFTDPAVDEYYYCIHMEMGHTIYHRFTRSDYEALL